MFVYITSLVTVLAIVGGCIGIYKLYYSLPKNISPKLKGGIIGVIIALIIFTTIIANLQNTVQSLTVSSQGKTALPTLARLVSPTAITTSTATLTPTPSPTSLPKPGTVLYQASTPNDWGKWALSADWKVITYNGLLINDGSARYDVGGNGPTAIAPYSLQGILNFAVEARIKSAPSGVISDYGIAACGSTTQNGWLGYRVGISDYGNLHAALWYPPNYNLPVTKDFNPGTSWYTYRIEVRGNMISFLIDGALIGP